MANNEKENILLEEEVYRVSYLEKIPLWRFVSPSNIKNLVSRVGEALDPHYPGHVGSLTIPARNPSGDYVWGTKIYSSKKELDKVADELIEFTDALETVHKLPRWQVKEVFASFDNEYQIIYTNEPYLADAFNKEDLSSLKGKKVAVAYTDCGYLKLRFIHDFNGDPLAKPTEKGIGFLAIHQNEKIVENVSIDGKYFSRDKKKALFALEDNLAKFKKEQEPAMTEQKKTTCSFGTKHQYNIDFLADKVPLWRLVSKSNIDKLINNSNELLKPNAPIFVGSLTNPARGNEWFWNGLIDKTKVQECADQKISFIDALGQRSTLPRWMVEEVIASFSDEYHIVVISDISNKSSFPNADSLKGKKVATFYQQYGYGKFHFQDNFQGNLEGGAEKGIGFLSVDLNQKEVVAMVINDKTTTNINEDRAKKLEIINQIDDCFTETKIEEAAKMTEDTDKFPEENSVYIKDDLVFVRGVEKLLSVGPHGFRIGKNILDAIPKERWKDIRIGYAGRNKEINNDSILVDGSWSEVKTVEDIKGLIESRISSIEFNGKEFIGELEKLKEEFKPSSKEQEQKTEGLLKLKPNTVYIEGDKVFVSAPIGFQGYHGSGSCPGIFVDKDILDVIPRERWKDIRIGLDGNNKEINNDSILIEGFISYVKNVSEIRNSKLNANNISDIFINGKSVPLYDNRTSTLKYFSEQFKPQRKTVKLGDLEIDEKWVEYLGKEVFDKFAVEIKSENLKSDFAWKITFSNSSVYFRGDEGKNLTRLSIDAEKETVVKSVKDYIEKYNKSTTKVVKAESFGKNGMPKDFSGIIVNANGLREWYLDGNLHREDGPAREWPNGTKAWYLKGYLHREDGPAAEYADGSKFWYLNGKQHREDGPACEYPDGGKHWCLNGRLHRVDGPAVEKANGEKVWYLNGKYHRVDGPAIEYPNAYKAWYLNGKHHRVDGPAIEYPNAYKAWYLNGKQHREDGPACEYPDGGKHWFLDGKRHRVDGPAVEKANGIKWWYLNGKSYSEAEWKVAVEKLKESELPVLELKVEEKHPANYTGIVKWDNGYKAWFLNGKCHREDGPATEDPDGTKHWYLNGKYHREDGPAIEYANGSKLWYLNGKQHREDGPAYEYANGDKHWFLNGKRHRVDGPAIEWADGDKHWWLNGERHRVDGPAVEKANGEKAWWLKGKSYPTIADWKKTVHLMDGVPQSKIEAIKEIAISDAQIVAERIAAIKIAEAIQTMLVAALTSHLKNKKQKSELTEHLNKFFASDNGQIMIKFVLGTAAPMFVDHLPEKYHNIANKLSTELRVQAETSTATKLMETVMPTILKFAGDFIRVEDEDAARIRVDIVEDNSSPQQTEQQEQEQIQDYGKSAMLN